MTKIELGRSGSENKTGRDEMKMENESDGEESEMQREGVKR